MKHVLTATLLLLFVVSHNSVADGSSIDKIYHPYVNALEKELEYRVIQARKEPTSNTLQQLHKLGAGKSINERWFIEAYIVAEKFGSEDLALAAYEFESKWQLTEQGEYAVDWGLLAEIEKAHDKDAFEAKLALLVAKDWQKFTAIGNVFLINEWGEGIQSEQETAASLQVRYRLYSHFEPAIEWYKSQDTHGIGPALTGAVKTGRMNQLFWHVGWIIGLNDSTANNTLKLQLEYEFY